MSGFRRGAVSKCSFHLFLSGICRADGTQDFGTSRTRVLQESGRWLKEEGREVLLLQNVSVTVRETLRRPADASSTVRENLFRLTRITHRSIPRVKLTILQLLSRVSPENPPNRARKTRRNPLP